MSIIEDTLRNLQDNNGDKDDHQDITVAQVTDKNSSTNMKPAGSRTFIVVSIYLTLFGLGSYYGLEKYQEHLGKKRENMNYDLNYLKPLSTTVDLSREHCYY